MEDEADARPPAPPSPAEAIAAIRIRAPTRGNRRLDQLIDAVNADPQVKAWWHMAGVTAARLGLTDHSWVHVQVVTNIALRLARLLFRRGVVPAMVTDHGMGERDAEVVIAAAALFHCVGMSIHRTDHESYSLFLTADKLNGLLAGVYPEPERSRVEFEAGRLDIHSISAYAIDEVRISAGDDKAIRVEIEMSNSAGIFQVDEGLGAKLRGTPLAEHMEVIARIEGEHEKRLVPVFRL